MVKLKHLRAAGITLMIIGVLVFVNQTYQVLRAELPRMTKYRPVASNKRCYPQCIAMSKKWEETAGKLSCEEACLRYCLND